MNKNKITVGVIFGGRSAEHEVSLQSARNILEAIDKNKFNAIPIGIDKKGHWWKFSDQNCFKNPTDPNTISLNLESSDPLPLSALETRADETKLFDVAFPIIHGPYGEDGKLQGLLEMLDYPYVGPKVLGSAVGMDKDVMKRLLRDAGIPIAKFLTFYRGENIDLDTIIDDLGSPCFVKPANMGSSVGVSQAFDKRELEEAIKLAFSHDNKILIEEAIVGHEIECAVLGNTKPEASTIGKVLPGHDFYSYEAKYLDENGATLEIPAKLSEIETKRAQDMAILTFNTLECRGLGRVDMFLKADGTMLVNEINTLPGFTNISMYPKLWEVSGLPYSALITRLIELALE